MVVGSSPEDVHGYARAVREKKSGGEKQKDWNAPREEKQKKNRTAEEKQDEEK
jgi:hypothetical protein